ncbi:MAG: Hsp20/alpha crystallin family protein [Blastocatellia bacterium]
MTKPAVAKNLANLEQQLNSLFNPAAFSVSAEDLGFAGHGPAIDICEDDNNLYLIADLPGFRSENVQIRYENRTLTVSGEKTQEELPNVRYHRTESFSGRFQRSFSLPLDIDIEKIGAELKNGLLTITLPKQEVHKPRQITVKVN